LSLKQLRQGWAYLPVMALKRLWTSCPIRDHTNQSVPGIGDVEPSRGIDRESGRGIERDEKGGDIIQLAYAARAADPGDRRNDAGGRDAVHAVAAEIRDEEIALSIESEVARLHEACGGRIHGVSAGCFAASCERRDRAVGRNASHPRVAEIGDEEVAAGVESEAVRLIQAGFRSGAPIARESAPSRACDRRDTPVGGDFANAVIKAVGDVDRARTVDDEAFGRAEAR
jgi:hypothetical protein